MKQVLSILLAVVFLISSTGFTIVTHLCGGKIHKQDINFVVEDLACGMEKIEKTPCADNTINNNCCQNEFQNFKIHNEYESSTDNVKFDTQFFIAFTTTYFDLFTTENTNYSPYLNYHPPLPDQDIPVLFQSFLI